MSKKKESNIGKQYERDVMALIGLKCLLRNDIQNFWLLTNTSGVEKFDDLILHVEYKDNRKELFFMQLKHKEKGDKLIFVRMFKRKQDDFCLEMFQGAYESVMKNTEFFSSNDISMDTKIFFVLHNNCKVEMRSEDPAKICFELVKEEDFRSFISSNASKNVSTEYMIKDIDSNAEFLSQFYFYAGQLNSKDVPFEIERLIGLNSDVVVNMMKYFYDFSDSDSSIEKLYKLDIKTKLLGYIFGDFSPPSGKSRSLFLMPVFEKYDVILIHEEDSADTIWSEILGEMRAWCKLGTLESTDWEKPLPTNVQNEFRKCLNMAEGLQINTKHIYIHMVAERLVPFYIESKNRFFKAFFEDLMTKLEIITVIFDSNKLFIGSQNFMNRGDLKYLRDISDLDEKQYLALTNRVNISLQGKRYIPLSSIIDNDRKIKQIVSIDSLISLLDVNLEFGSSREEPIYIQRKLKLPVINEKILENAQYLFIVCGLPPTAISSFNFDSLWMPLEDFVDLIELGFHPIKILKEEIFPILLTTVEFDRKMMNLIDIIPNVQLYCVLQWVYTSTDGENRFILKETNGSLEFLTPSICDGEYYQLNDDDMFEIYKNSKINLICNNAGMGKTLLLNHMSRKFPPTEWIVHLEFGKFSNEMKGIGNVEEFMKFIRDIEMKSVGERHRGMFELIYDHYAGQGKIVLLLDDYEEINERRLLRMFKEANEKGLRIWMVGRPLLKTELEENFRVFSMELDEFSVDDQNEFFRKFFAQNNNNEDFERRLDMIEKTRRKLEPSFIGICQQTMMLAEVLNSDGELIGNEIRINDLYEKFISLHISQNNLKNREFILRTLSKLALYSFFSKEVLKRLFDWDEFECDLGIFKQENPKAVFVTEFQKENIPIFSHKTYAEYLAARWLAQIAVKQIKKETLFNISEVLELLYFPALTNVRSFFDNILTTSNLIHSTIINNDILTNEMRSGVGETDILGRTVFHMLMSYGKRYIIHTDSEIKKALHNVEERAVVCTEQQRIVLEVPEVVPKHETKETKKKVFLNGSYTEFIMAEDELLHKNAIEYALMSGSLEELEFVFRTHVHIFNLNNEFVFRNMKHETLLLMIVHCIQNKFDKIFRKLLTFHEIINSLKEIRISPSGKSLLHLAVEYRNSGAVKALIYTCNSIESWGVDKEGNSPLHSASETFFISNLFFVLGKYTDSFLNLKNRKGFSHLHCFAYNGNEKCVKKLLGYPAVEVDAKCNKGCSPFIISIINEHLKTAEVLKIKGAQIDLGNKKGMTALHFAVLSGNYECVERLIDWGAKLNAKTKSGTTPLMEAARRGHLVIVLKLLMSGVKINLGDKKGWTALHHAIRWKHYNIIFFLLQYGANANRVTKKGQTPLIISCIFNVPEAIEMFIESSLSIKVEHYSKYERGTALDIAKKKHHTSCMNKLAELTNNGRKGRSGSKMTVLPLRPTSRYQQIRPMTSRHSS